MPETTQDETRTQSPAAAEEVSVDGLLAEDSLVEEVSIDGMCGVY